MAKVFSLWTRRGGDKGVWEGVKMKGEEDVWSAALL